MLAAQTPQRPKPPGRGCVPSERHVVVEVGPRLATTGSAVLPRPAEELDVLGDDLAAVALDAFAIGPAGVVKPAAHRDEHPLCRMLGDDAAEAVEAGDAMPLG